MTPIGITCAIALVALLWLTIIALISARIAHKRIDEMEQNGLGRGDLRDG